MTESAKLEEIIKLEEEYSKSTSKKSKQNILLKIKQIEKTIIT